MHGATIKITNQCIFLALIFPVVLAILKFSPTRILSPIFCDVILIWKCHFPLLKLWHTCEEIIIYLQLMNFFLHYGDQTQTVHNNHWSSCVLTCRPVYVSRSNRYVTNTVAAICMFSPKKCQEVRNCSAQFCIYTYWFTRIFYIL